MKKLIVSIIIATLGVYLYGSIVEIDGFKIKEYTIKDKDIPKSFEELKIVHFSDILYTKNEEKLNELVENINKLNADIIIFSGDLLNNNMDYSDKDYEILQNSLKKMNASLFKYAVIGDNDLKRIDDYKDILYESGFKLLDNEATLLFYKDMTPINIIGLTDLNNIEELLASDTPYNYSLVITHRPDSLTELSGYDIDTVLSGHSLGGIINVPYYGGIIKKDGAKTYINDYYKLNNTDIYISNGLGYEKRNFRLFNTPSINVYRFKNN